MGSRLRGGDGGLPKFAVAQAASRMDGAARRVVSRPILDRTVGRYPV